MNWLESIPQTGSTRFRSRIALAMPARRVTPARVTSSGPPESPMQMFGDVDRTGADHAAASTQSSLR